MDNKTRIRTRKILLPYYNVSYIVDKVDKVNEDNFKLKLTKKYKKNVIIIGYEPYDIGEEPKSFLKKLEDKIMQINIQNTVNNLLNKVHPVSKIEQTKLNQPNVSTSEISSNVKKTEEPIKSFKEILGDSIFVFEEGKKTLKKQQTQQIQHEKCNHNPNDNSTTLEQLKKRTMQFPPQIFMVCRECHKGFRFVKCEDGSLKEIE